MQTERNHVRGPTDQVCSCPEGNHPSTNPWPLVIVVAAGLLVGWYFTLPSWYRGLVSMVLVPVLMIAFAATMVVVLLRRHHHHEGDMPMSSHRPWWRSPSVAPPRPPAAPMLTDYRAQPVTNGNGNGHHRSA